MANSAVPLGSSSMRPRANTISHVDHGTLGMIAAANTSASHHDYSGFGLGHSGMHGLSGVNGYHFRGMSTAAGHHGNPHVLPKIDTKSGYVDVNSSLRTAPPPGGFGGDMNPDNMFFGPGSTINPAQLHFSNSPQAFAFEEPPSPFPQSFAGYPPNQGFMDSDGSFPWLTSFDHQMSFNNEQAVDGSSPSANSDGSPDGMSEVMLDGSSNPTHNSLMWRNPMMSQPSFASSYSMDLSGQSFPELYPTGQLSPKTLNSQFENPDQYFSSSALNSQPPMPMFTGIGNQSFQSPVPTKPETPSNSAASISSSNRQSSVTSISTDSITEVTRQALISSLSQPYTYGLKTSQPQVSSPLSPGFTGRSRSMSSLPLPSTYDLQRYVGAYIQYFHPHLPFLHIASLSFDSPAFTSNLRASSGHFALGQAGIVGGGGSLILAMAAIGALYEYDLGPSKELFEMAKNMIQLYLQERRKTDMAAAPSANQSPSEASMQNTPLWLVQAMLLNVIYGHNSGDKTAAGIANTHCAALVSLARGADLVMPSSNVPVSQGIPQNMKHEDIHMGGEGASPLVWNGYNTQSTLDAETEWHNWKIAEERKRTLYAIFILSSLLVSAYNCTPALMNSEIRLDLPCDEGLWAAESADSWRALGGSGFAEQNATSFASSLSSLLTAGQRQQQMQQRMSQPLDQSGSTFENLPDSDVRPSTFGCLVLINALHNYIWETRQRHMGRQWTTPETEAMHAHIEPALRAWQAAWSSNTEHSLERPNPSGASSLSADCIPLLDLAYVRLFVNLGRSKESFFLRDFDAMADELAHGTEIVQHAEHSGSSSPSLNASAAVSITSASSPSAEGSWVKVESDSSTSAGKQHQLFGQCSGKCSRRERHLRKAAFYAANSLTMSDRLNVTFADFNSRELPLQSALCAFDCAQILAEWVSTVQQRVGRYLGVLGRDEIDYSQAPGCIFLEEDDAKLLEKIREILNNAKIKLGVNVDTMASLVTTNGLNLEDCGYGSKILLLHARMFEKESVWPRKLLHPITAPKPADLD